MYGTMATVKQGQDTQDAVNEAVRLYVARFNSAPEAVLVAPNERPGLTAGKVEVKYTPGIAPGNAWAVKGEL